MNERPYHYKPRPRFFGTGAVFLGLELEVEAPDPEAKRQGLDAEANPNWCYAKHDGSLASDRGWELVTHPISISSWMSRQAVRDYHQVAPGTVMTARYKGETYTATMLAGGRVRWDTGPGATGEVFNSISAAGKAIRGGKSTNGYQFFGLTNDTARVNPTDQFFRLVRKLRELGYDSHNGGRCGFHVHISRKAFSQDGDLHNPKFFRFKCLVNGSLFRRLSQRASFQYCQQVPVDRDNFTAYFARNSAVNVTLKTVEVRIFRGNLREERLRKNLEAVIAAIEFASEGTTYTKPTDEEFTTWVNERTDRFPNLAAYINSTNSQTVEV